MITKIIGISLIILGISGIILPILPGWIFLFLGVKLLFPNFSMNKKFNLVHNM